MFHVLDSWKEQNGEFCSPQTMDTSPRGTAGPVMVNLGHCCSMRARGVLLPAATEPKALESRGGRGPSPSTGLLFSDGLLRKGRRGDDLAGGAGTGRAGRPASKQLRGRKLRVSLPRRTQDRGGRGRSQWPTQEGIARLPGSQREALRRFLDRLSLSSSR